MGRHPTTSTMPRATPTGAGGDALIQALQGKLAAPFTGTLADALTDSDAQLAVTVASGHVLLRGVHRSGQHPVRQGIDPLPQSRERRRQSRQMAPLRTDQRVQGHHSGVRRVRCLRFPEKPGLRTGPMPPQRFSVDRHRQDAASRAGLPRHGRQHLRHQGRGRGADRDAHRMPGLQRQAFLCGG